MCYYEYVCVMKAAKGKLKKKKVIDRFVTVRILRSTLSLLHENKKSTMIPVSSFIDFAVREKLNK
jgi:hypothetical protein